MTDLKKYLGTVLYGAVLTWATVSYASDSDLLVNIQFSTAATMYDVNKDTKEEEPNTFISSFTGNEGIIHGGTYWNLIQPTESSPNMGYNIGGKPLTGTYTDLKDAKEAPTKVSVTISNGVVVVTTTSQDKPNGRSHFFANGYGSLMSSGLFAMPDGLPTTTRSVIIGGLSPNLGYNLAFYGHSLEHQGVRCTTGLKITINDTTKFSKSFLYDEAREIKEGIDYLTFNGISPDAMGNITVVFCGYDTVSNKPVDGGWVSGIQIQATTKKATKTK